MNKTFTLVAAASLVACQSSDPAKLVLPDKTLQQPHWSDTEREQAIAIRRLHSDADASTFFIRLNDNEQPHYHDHHDLSVTILSGESTIHFKDHAVAVTPGDVVFIPKGSYHWAEHTGAAATVLFAVFSPEFTGNDKRLAE